MTWFWNLPSSHLSSVQLAEFQDGQVTVPMLLLRFPQKGVSINGTPKPTPQFGKPPHVFLPVFPGESLRGMSRFGRWPRVAARLGGRVADAALHQSPFCVSTLGVGPQELEGFVHVLSLKGRSDRNMDDDWGYYPDSMEVPFYMF